MSLSPKFFETQFYEIYKTLPRVNNIYASSEFQIWQFKTEFLYSLIWIIDKRQS